MPCVTSAWHRLTWSERRLIVTDRPGNTTAQFILLLVQHLAPQYYYLFDSKKFWTDPLILKTQHGCQGGLDLQYLQQRYEKGKQWCKGFMDSHHCYKATEHGGLADAHSALLQFQSKNGDGGDAFLGCHSELHLLTNNGSLCFHMSFSTVHSEIRITLMILDASLWPSRASPSLESN